MESNVGYISIVNTLVWTVPLVIAVWMLVVKKFKFRHFIAGILSYMLVYVVQQLLLAAVSLSVGNIIGENLTAVVAVYAIAIPPVAVLGTYFIYKRVLDEKNWYYTVGYGLGFGYASVIAEIGMKLFGNMLMAVMITDGDTSGFTGEQLEVYKSAEKIIRSQSGDFYIYVGMAAVMIFAVGVVNALLIRKSNENGKRFPMLVAYALYTVMYTLFTMVVYAGINKFVVILLIVAVIAFSVYYLTKSYDAQDTETEYVSRPSPLLGRNTDRRYRTKRKK